MQGIYSGDLTRGHITIRGHLVALEANLFSSHTKYKRNTNEIQNEVQTSSNSMKITSKCVMVCAAAALLSGANAEGPPIDWLQNTGTFSTSGGEASSLFACQQPLLWLGFLHARHPQVLQASLARLHGSWPSPQFSLLACRLNF